jgi:hypothetical protein
MPLFGKSKALPFSPSLIGSATMNPMTSQRELTRKHLDPKLLLRLRLFAVICLAMIVLTLFDLVGGHISWGWAGIGFAVGIGGGLVAGRMSAMVWHEDDAKVAGRMDTTGVIALCIYFILSIARHFLFEQWVHGPALLAITFAGIAGVMLGRLIVMSWHINRVLREQKLS